MTFEFYTSTREVLARVVSLCHNAKSKGVPFPEALITASRRQWLVELCAATSRRERCACKLVGYDGEELGEPLTHRSKVRIRWLHIETPEGQPHVVSVSFLDLKVHARPVPHGPMKLSGACGFRFSLAFFDTLAESTHTRGSSMTARLCRPSAQCRRMQRIP